MWIGSVSGIVRYQDFWLTSIDMITMIIKRSILCTSQFNSIIDPRYSEKKPPKNP